MIQATSPARLAPTSNSQVERVLHDQVLRETRRQGLIEHAAVAVGRALLIGAILGLWAYAAGRWVDRQAVSDPVAVLGALYHLIETGRLWPELWQTVFEVLAGYAFGALAAVLMASLFAIFPTMEEALRPFLIAVYSIPKVALAPLIILVFGIGLVSKVAVATALTLVVSTLTAYAGVKALDPDGEKLFYSLGASRMQVFRKLVVPFCLPWIISVLRVNIGLALTGAIVGEFIASPHGLGRAILYAGQTYDIALVWVAVLVLSTLAIVMYAAVSWLESILRKGVRQ